MRTTHLVTAGLVAAATLAGAAEAGAYQRTLTCNPSGSLNACSPGEEPRALYWPTSCVTYHINEAGSAELNDDAAIAAIQKGFQVWDEVSCGYLSVSFAGFTDEDRVGYNAGTANANIVVFRDDNWEHSAGILALTSVTFKASTGEIYDADIEINSEEYNLTTTDQAALVRIDVQNTVAHEAGHFIGLDHSAVSDSTMFATAPLRETAKRTLHPDDEAGFCDAYPVASDPNNQACWGAPDGFFERPVYGPGEDVPVDASNGPCACAAVDPTTPTPGWLVGLIGLGVVVFWRRRAA